MKTISSKEIRNKKMQYMSVMQEVKPLRLLPMLNVATLTMVSEYLETEYSNVSSYYSTHQKELEEYGIIKLKIKNFTDAGYTVDPEMTRGCGIVRYDDASARISSVGARCMSEAAIFNMALGIGKSEIAEKIKAAAALAETEAYQPNESTDEDINNNVENMTENTYNNVKKMAENILTFTNAEFGSIRVMEIDGQPWFVGKDVADGLGYLNTKDAIKSHVDEEDKLIVQKSDFPTLEIPNRGMVAINESGLYSLIMSSKLPTAKQFKRWVTSEVLPSVRKNGGYIAGQEDLTEEELMAKALLVAHKALEERDKKIAELHQTNKAMSEKINTWDKKSIINALIRSYAGKCFNGDCKNAFADFYRQYDYKYHTRLKSRRDSSGKKSILDCLSGDEIDNAVKLAVAICESRSINTGKIINEVNAAACGA